MTNRLTDLNVREWLKANDWAILLDSNNWRSITAYKWKRDVEGEFRHEVHIVFDKGGRVEAWSQWQNRRRTIDQEPGRRHRLEAFLTDWKPPSEALPRVD